MGRASGRQGLRAAGDPRVLAEAIIDDLVQKAEDMISKANAAAARQEEANAQLAKQIDRMEALKVEQTLGGKTEAGQPPAEDENAGAKKILAGTGYENMFEPPKESYEYRIKAN